MDRIKYAHVDRQDESALLWESIAAESRIDRFHEKIVVHDKSVLFGYADVTVVIATAYGVILPIKLRGIVVKSLKGQPHIDMPAEKGADNQWYDHFMPRSASFRAVLTSLIFADPEVAQTVERAAAAPPPVADASLAPPLATSSAATGTTLAPPVGAQPAAQASSVNPFRD